MKRCAKCGEMKPLDRFATDRSRPDSLMYRCRTCLAEYRQANREKIAEQRAKYYQANREQIAEKAATYLQANREKVHKQQATCRQVNREKIHEQQATYRRTKKYGLAPGRYDEVFAEQGGLCAICGDPPGKRCLDVDHDHGCCPGRRACGQCVRGLLCPGCNTGRNWDTVPDWLVKAKAYLDRHRGRR